MSLVSTDEPIVYVTGSFTPYKDRQSHALSQIKRLVVDGILVVKDGEWEAISRAIRKGREVALCCPGHEAYQQASQRLRQDGQTTGCRQTD
jgi:hypothetical protein